MYLQFVYIDETGIRSLMDLRRALVVVSIFSMRGDHSKRYFNYLVGANEMTSAEVPEA